ncbi:hypothetical protein BC940DRAFT_332424 [Gongronella butleri]|nr:hypothetical protein BC940DRAFT_332424 [Gongronella butleri]
MLNSKGWTVKRQRHAVTTTPLAFGSPALSPQPTMKKTLSTTSKTSVKRKQGTLFQYLQASSPASTSANTASLSTSNTVDKQDGQAADPKAPKAPKAPENAVSTFKPAENTSNGTDEATDDNMICVIKRRVPWTDYWPVLEASFGENALYPPPATLSPPSTPPTPTHVLTIKKKQPLALLEAPDDENSLRSDRRRRFQEVDGDDDNHSDDDDAELPYVFSNAMILAPAKQLCGARSRHRRQLASKPIWQDGYVQHHACLDHLARDFVDDDNEPPQLIVTRRAPSIAATNQLLLDIANEYLLFENNTWCKSYLQ